MKIRDEKHIIANQKSFNLLKRRVNWYYSIALVEMPVFSFNMKTRAEQSKEFDIAFESLMLGYDWAIDLDTDRCECGHHKRYHSEGKCAECEEDSVDDPDLTPCQSFRPSPRSFEKTLEDARKLQAWMLARKIPFSCRFSGSGFHFVVYNKDIWSRKLKFIPELSPVLCGVLSKALKSRLSLDTLDDSIYDCRRILKLPFTIDTKTGNVCRTLKPAELQKFQIRHCTPQFCFDNRGVFYGPKENPGESSAVLDFVYEVFDGHAESSKEVYEWIKDNGQFKIPGEKISEEEGEDYGDRT
jgi:hypothetical protein